MPKKYRGDDEILQTEALGCTFKTPIGVAAGFDKNAECMGTIKDMGFGFIEIGSVCPQPQPGNPKPRVFRLKSEGSSSFDTIINRYGFNGEGSGVVQNRLREFRNEVPLGSSFAVGVNLGKNKVSPPESDDDYIQGIERLSLYADYMVINVSSPNTPQLRGLQDRGPLEKLLNNTTKSILKQRKKQKRHIPLLIKIAPDLTKEQKKGIAELALEYAVDGIIVSNTTIDRDGIDLSKNEAGGLSGKPLFNKSTKVLKEMYRLTGGKLTMIGVGGVFSGSDALDKIEAGASLVQVYTALACEGAPLLGRIEKELIEELHRRGYNSISEAVGAKA
jgi:dihydroorotate dehydrogenase